MPVYEYTALDAGGKKHRGIIDADSRAAARQKIRAGGHYPVTIEESSARPSKAKARSISLFGEGGRVKQQEIHVVTRQLATLLGAGIPLVPALDGLIEQVENPTMKKIIAQIKETVNEGNSLTSALGDHPRLFSTIYVNMVRAGEASGSLAVVLERLAEFGENQEAMKARVRAALMYPIFMAVVGSLVLFGLVTFIVPNITKVFDEMEQALPLPTVLLIGASDFFRSFWWLVLLAIAGSALLFNQVVKTPRGREVYDRLKLRLPLFGPLNLRIASARFGRTLGSLLQSGVPLLSSLQIVRNIVNNVLLAEIIDQAAEDIGKGRNLSQSLRQSKYFPPMLVQMISVGEQSGALEKMLGKAAEAYEREVESKVMALTSMIEPIMILAMGGVVSFIVISILLPIFEMNQLIR